MTDFIESACPYCGEGVEIDIDRSGGSRQRFVQDCPVCCQPWEVEVTRDSDDDWEVTLRAADE